MPAGDRMTADRGTSGIAVADADVVGERDPGTDGTSRVAGAGVEVHPPAARSRVTATTWTNGRGRAGADTRARYQVGSGTRPSCRLADRGVQGRGSTHEGARPLSVTEVPELRIDLAPAAEAIERAGRRVTELLTHVEDPDRPTRGLEWTLGDLAAHLAARTERFAAYLSGVATPEGEIAGIAAENQQDIRARRERPLGDHIDEVRSNVASFVATTRGKLGADPFPWYSGVTLDVATAAGVLLGELIVHGYDAARTLGHPWPIAATDARTIVRAAAALAPWYVDEEATRGDRTTFRIAARGGPVFRVRIDDGTASVEPADGDADCTIHADPVALVLLSYGRITRWRAAGKGKLVATGRRPWRALRFERSFRSP